MEDSSLVDRTTSADVGAVILAAGASARMGRPKQALEFRGQTLLRRAVLAALEAGCRPVIVVTGAHSAASREQLRGLGVREAENDRWESGMGSSVAAGIRALVEADAEVAAAVLMVCDQPFVSASVLAELVAAHRSTGKPIVASRYGGGCGVPALFGRGLFEELAELGASGGAKAVIHRHSSEAHLVDFALGEVDVDTPEDLAWLSSFSGSDR